jgi:hypothetical protein
MPGRQICEWARRGCDCRAPSSPFRESPQGTVGVEFGHQRALTRSILIVVRC